MATSLDEIIELVRQNPRLVIAEDFEIAVQRTRSQGRKYQNGDRSRESIDSSVWVSLRILHRKRPGRSATGVSSKEGLSRLVEAAFESATRSSPDPWFRFPIWKGTRGESQPSELRSFSIDSYASLFSELKTKPGLLEEAYEVSDVDTLIFRKSERHSRKHSRRFHSLQLSVFQKLGDEISWLKEERAQAGELIERRDWLEGLLGPDFPVSPARLSLAGKQLRLLLGPSVLASLLKKVAPWFSAEKTQTGRSPLLGCEGDLLFSPQLTLVDDGCFPGAAQSVPFDMEGALTQATTLVDRGTLREYLYDTYTATRENRLSTGNFLRSVQSLKPRVGPSTFFIRPGETGPESLLGKLGDGYWIERVETVELVSPFLPGVRIKGPAWRVSAGQCVERIREVHFSCSAIDLLKRAVEVGDDLSFYGAFGSPSILFEDIPLSE